MRVTIGFSKSLKGVTIAGYEVLKKLFFVLSRSNGGKKRIKPIPSEDLFFIITKQITPLTVDKNNFTRPVQYYNNYFGYIQVLLRSLFFLL